MLAHFLTIGAIVLSGKLGGDQNALLPGAVLRRTHRGKMAKELYCNIGPISLTLAEWASQVIGVEVIPQTMEDAKGKACRNGLAHKPVSSVVT